MTAPLAQLMAAPVQTTLQVQVRGRGGKHPPFECRRQTPARTSSLPPPRTVEQTQACLLHQSEQDGGSGADHIAGAGAWSGSLALSIRVPAADTRARTSSPLPPRTVKQPQACSTSRSLMAAPVQTTLQVQVRGRGGKHSPSECRRQTRARTLTTPLPRTVEQPQACSTSRRLMAALVWSTWQVQVRGPGGKHSPSECWAHTRARTLTMPPPRTIEQPQANSISRCCMAAPVQTTFQDCRHE